MNFSEARKNMVECQLKTNGITNDRIVAAFLSVPREEFYPPHLTSCAYVDEDVKIANDRWSLEPLVEARLMNAADLKPADVVLLVGASSPALAAYLAQIVTTVIVIDDDQSLLDNAQSVSLKLELTNIAYIKSPMTGGYGAEAPYDVVIVSGAAHHVPAALFDQVVDGGRLVCIEKSRENAQGDLRLYTKSGGHISGTFISLANTPYLKGFEPQSNFEF